MIVEIEGLQKIYNGKQRVVAVDGIDLSVQEGELFGLLGPNGAGKTTTLKVASGQMRPTGGHVHIAGRHVNGASADALARADKAWLGRLITRRVPLDR